MKREDILNAVLGRYHNPYKSSVVANINYLTSLLFYKKLHPVKSPMDAIGRDIKALATWAGTDPITFFKGLDSRLIALEEFIKNSAEAKKPLPFYREIMAASEHCHSVTKEWGTCNSDAQDAQIGWIAAIVLGLIKDKPEPNTRYVTLVVPEAYTKLREDRVRVARHTQSKIVKRPGYMSDMGGDTQYHAGLLLTSMDFNPKKIFSSPCGGVASRLRQAEESAAEIKRWIEYRDTVLMDGASEADKLGIVGAGYTHQEFFIPVLNFIERQPISAMITWPEDSFKHNKALRKFIAYLYKIIEQGGINA